MWALEKQCRRQSIQSRGAKSESRGAKDFFIDFSPAKTLHNAITSQNCLE